MILIEQHPDGYSLRRTDAPTAQPLIVAEDELTEAVAALFADDLDDYTQAWDQMAQAAQGHALAA